MDLDTLLLELDLHFLTTTSQWVQSTGGLTKGILLQNFDIWPTGGFQPQEITWHTICSQANTNSRTTIRQRKINLFFSCHVVSGNQFVLFVYIYIYIRNVYLYLYLYIHIHCKYIHNFAYYYPPTKNPSKPACMRHPLHSRPPHSSAFCCGSPKQGMPIVTKQSSMHLLGRVMHPHNSDGACDRTSSAEQLNPGDTPEELQRHPKE